MITQNLYSLDEIFTETDIEEVIRNAADNRDAEDELPYKFTVYEQKFALNPASAYLPSDIMGSMDEKALDMCGEFAIGEGLFAKHSFDQQVVESEIRAAVDAVIAKHQIQPTAYVAVGKSTQHFVEWYGPDSWVSAPL